MPDLLPPNATPQERAISLVTDRLPDVPIKHLWSPQTCPAGILPWLGWALSVDDWDPTWPEQTQRNVIAASIENHRRKGTIGALRQALSRIGYEVEINEQTGVAYTFALRMKLGPGETAGGAVAENARQRIIQTALSAKNVRSELADTIFMSEGGDAVLYSGGVPIIGAEVEIGAGPSPLPLDIERDWLVTSFWTVRMHSDYTGPIARVKRSSDNAELDYSSLTELKAFVGGGAWSYLRFYNQANGQSALSPNLSGSFDANGIPRANLLPSSVAEINAQFDKFTTPQTTLVFAAQSEASGEVQSVNVTLFTDNPNERFLNLSNASSLSSVRIFGPPGAIITTIASTDARQVFGSVSSNTSVVIRRDNVTSTVAGDATLAVSKFVMSAEDFSSSSSTPCRLWGAAFWRKGLSPSDFQATLTKVKTRLQF